MVIPDRDPVYATCPLVETLCRLASDADPTPVTVSLSTVPASDLDAPVREADGSGVETTVRIGSLDPDTPVFAEFYVPEAGRALRDVFGVDLSTPAGTDGRFLSHPDGDPDVSLTDDLHVRILVAVPPYEPETVRAFDRNGRRLDLRLVDARSPEPAPEEAIGAGED
jgi:hypothetical protein